MSLSDKLSAPPSTAVLSSLARLAFNTPPHPRVCRQRNWQMPSHAGLKHLHISRKCHPFFSSEKPILNCSCSVANLPVAMRRRRHARPWQPLRCAQDLSRPSQWLTTVRLYWRTAVRAPCAVNTGWVQGAGPGGDLAYYYGGSAVCVRTTGFSPGFLGGESMYYRKG